MIQGLLDSGCTAEAIIALVLAIDMGRTQVGYILWYTQQSFIAVGTQHPAVLRR